MPRNSPMSAPAMKPLGLAERSTRPFGGSRSSFASTSLSSVSTSSDSVLALAPCLVEHQPGDAVVVARELPVPPRAPVASPGDDRAELEIARRENVPDLSHAPPSLHRLDQHGAALPAADAFGGDALLDAEPPHRVDEMQHDAVAAGADRMAEADGAAVDIELVARDARRRRRRGRAPRGRTCRPARRRGRPAPARRRPR